jgi:DNA-binding transcriptional LysR family regulator
MKDYRVFKLLYNTNNESCYSHLNNNEGDEIMIEIRLLEQLAAFAEYGTLSEAAERLHTSQPTLTRSMKQLEDELGVPLFIRGKNHLALNETGLRAAEYAKHVLVADRDFEAKVRAYDRSLHTISIGFCAPVPQTVLTPMINNVFDGMTISADMSDDALFEDKLRQGIYQLAVLHYKPESPDLFCKKIGSEQLYISLPSGNPLAFYPEVHLKDINGLSILLLSRIGFWSNVHRDKTPDSKYLLQIDESAFMELAENSEYPIFSSSYFIRAGQTMSGRINVRIADPECRTYYYLVCLSSEQKKYKPLFELVHENTIS